MDRGAWWATLLLPRPGRGAGTLIPSAQRLVWAAKQPLGNAALGVLFADKELCLRSDAGGSVWTCTPMERAEHALLLCLYDYPLILQ